MTTTLPHPEAGILRFMNNIRFSLAMDSGRQLVQDHIQVHGFKFLDDYLGNVLAGPQRDGIVGVLKTPGRKRTKTMVVAPPGLKLKNIVLSLEDDDKTKQNAVPVNEFHKALLQAKDNGHAGESLDTRSQADVVPQEINKQNKVEAVPKVTVNSDMAYSSEPDQRRFGAHDLTLDECAASHSEQKLFIIAEDDEIAERTRGSIHVTRHDSNTATSMDIINEHGAVVNLQATSPTYSDNEDKAQLTNATDIGSSTSTSFYHSIPLDTPEAIGPMSEGPSKDSSESTVVERRTYMAKAKDPNAINDQHEQDVHSVSQPLANHHSTPPIPFSTSYPSSDGTKETLTGPLPSLPPSTSNTPTSPTVLCRKTSVTPFPSLPAPMPLRKSVRAPREPSMGTGSSVQGAASGIVVGGKRTSWLMKAREAKAMEEGGMKAVGGSRTPVFRGGGLKRKSGEMAGGGEDVERINKMPKVIESELDFDFQEAKMLDHAVESQMASVQQQLSSIPPLPQPKTMDVVVPTLHSEYWDGIVPDPNQDGEEGILDRLKRTLEGMGARTGKSMGKSLGDAAAVSALAEARAAAEARVVERERKELGDTDTAIVAAIDAKTVHAQASARKSTTRLSVSDLISAYQAKEKELPHLPSVGNGSTSTTPPNSPPSTRPSGGQLPVFSKPSGPVFKPKPPVTKEPLQPREFSLLSTAFTRPSPISAGMSASLPSPQNKKPAPLSAQSTYDSLASQKLFDDDDPPAWMPRTQDTEYSSGFGSQSQHLLDSQPSQRVVNNIDDDDSWPLEERLASQWALGKDETMTWSTLTESRTGPPVQSLDRLEETGMVLGTSDMEVDREQLNDYDEVEEMLRAGGSTVGFIETDRMAGTQSQLSVASSSSSSNLGIFSHASKLVSSVLGGSRKGKPEVKSLQLAAAAAKKQQEEKDKKAARMKEMENRRQLAVQRKAEEKVRAAEEERKNREEGERRKREREELADKRSLKAPGKKVEDDNTKKRKIVAEKPPSKDKKDTSASKVTKPSLATSTKVLAKSVLKQPTAALSSSAAFNAAMTVSTPSVASKMEVKALKNPAVAISAPTAAKIKGKAKAMVLQEEIDQPSQVLQTRMAARAKAQMKAARQQDPSNMPTESIELPDINSEYSDSEDEDRPRTFDPPNWAQSPELSHALQQQSTVNPDDIFGPIRPLKMEEMFRTRQSRFRSRTSSANWTGTDGLTVEEEIAYARRMGYR